MKIVFNDLSELTIQAYSETGGKLNIKTISATPKELRETFNDEVKARKMTIKERDTLAVFEGYTEMYSIEEYAGKIYGVNMLKKEVTPEVKTEITEAAIKVAEMQAQTLPDEQAIEVQVLYPEWSGDGVEYEKDFKVNYGGILYKVLQKHTSQADWTPTEAPSLFAKILTEPGAIKEWEQPESTNPYMKGDKVSHNGKTWESIVDNNVWEPGVQGTEALWKEVEA